MMMGSEMKKFACLVSLCLTLGVAQASVFAQEKDGEKERPAGDTQAAPVNSPETDRIVYEMSGVDQKAVIESSPLPAFTEKAKQKGIGGSVRLRMVLGADGQVGDIKALTKLSSGLTENAIEAARLIKFRPAVKDGRKVSQYVTFEFTFAISGKSLPADEFNKVYYHSDCVDFSRVSGNLIFFSDSKEAKKAGYRKAKTKCP
jgi:TonB family protein